MKTYRFKGHSMSDAQSYRTKDEVKEYQLKDPISKVLKTLEDNKWIDEAGIEKIEETVKAMVEESVKFAEESPYPEADELFKDVYAEGNYPYIIE
jgi:pyruvate dehydrogenase E1 component alpha subunit